MPFGSGRQVGTSRPHYFEGGVGFGSPVDVLAAIADVRLWSPAFVQTFRRTCQQKRRLQRLRAKNAGRDLFRDSSMRYNPGNMHTTVCVTTSLRSVAIALLARLAHGE
jgi:hypothetical protein